MSSLKLGSKADGFQRKGQEWFCTTGLPSDIILEVEEMAFHLHKFPLVSKSGKIAKQLEAASEKNDVCHIQLLDVPGGPDAFELAAKFCYGVRLELTASNVVVLRCAAEYLEMTEEFGEGNLIARTEGFLSQVVLKNWKDSIRALHSCESVKSYAEVLGIVKRCVDSIAMKACTNPYLFGWPMMEHGSMQSPGGSILWNGISTGAKPRNARSDWWFEDTSILGLPLYKQLIMSMTTRGVKPENIAGALTHYAKKYLPALNRRQGTWDGSSRFSSLSLATVLSEAGQKDILETIESLLPLQKGVTSTKFLSGLLRSAMILNVSPACKSNLERRIGMQLEQASLEDLLLPNLSYNSETLYDIDCIQHIVNHFLLLEQSTGGDSSPHSIDEGQLMNSPSPTPLMMVARLVDSYLAEVASDANLKPSKFLSLAECLPDFARIMDDGLYRAIDIYLKAHSWLLEQEREQLCRVMDCQKLSLEACTHAAQNERLPLRVIVQVLFFEQLQLRTAIASCFMVSENLDASRPLRYHPASDGTLPPAALRGDAWTNAIRENQVLKEDMDNMRLRVIELEKECSNMREEIEKLGKVKGRWQVVSKAIAGKLRSQLCRTKNSAVQNQTWSGSCSEHSRSKRPS